MDNASRKVTDATYPFKKKNIKYNQCTWTHAYVYKILKYIYEL